MEIISIVCTFKIDRGLNPEKRLLDKNIKRHILYKEENIWQSFLVIVILIVLRI